MRRSAPAEPRGAGGAAPGKDDDRPRRQIVRPLRASSANRSQAPQLQVAVQAAVQVAVQVAVHVTIVDGRVTLTGEATSLASRWAAGDAARGVRGVRAVVNEIAVPALGSAQPRDADLAVAAIEALGCGACAPIANLAVAVRGGWLTLQGEVGLPGDRQTAHQVVCGLPGVRGITNLLTVRLRGLNQ